MPIYVYQKYLFAFVVSVVFAATIVGYWEILVLPIGLEGLVYVWLLAVMAFGFSYWAASLLLSLSLDSQELPKVESLSRQPKIALLYLTCDDVDLSVARKLSHQTYSHLSIFVLDDSHNAEERSKVDTLPYEIVRRSNNKGFKAGNINNWLFSQGQDFEYIFVCDADSILPVHAVDELVHYAEHIENSQVAIFETLILPWNTDREFVRVQLAAAKVGGRFKLRVENRLRTTLSVGHNNLIRVAALREVGGFNENYVAEDYATSLDLLRTQRWECKTVPLETYERAPANLAEFLKRETRWTFQTFQLCGLKSKGLTPNLLVRLLAAFHHYSIPMLFCAAMLIIGITAITPYLTEVAGRADLRWHVSSTTTTSKWLAIWIIFFGTPLGLSAIVMRAEGVGLVMWLKSLIFHASTVVSMLLPLVRQLHLLLREGRLDFDVTGRSRRVGQRKVYTDYLLVQAVVLGVLMISLWTNRISALNLFWIIPIVIGPWMMRIWERKTEA